MKMSETQLIHKLVSIALCGKRIDLHGNGVDGTARRDEAQIRRVKPTQMEIEANSEIGGEWIYADVEIMVDRHRLPARAALNVDTGEIRVGSPQRIDGAVLRWTVEPVEMLALPGIAPAEPMTVTAVTWA